jgi:hypothetical protein
VSEPVSEEQADGNADVVPAPAVQAESAGPSPLGVEVPATGHPEVDALLTRLGDADILPTEDHIEVYEDVHRGLRDALTALDNNRS